MDQHKAGLYYSVQSARTVTVHKREAVRGLGNTCRTSNTPSINKTLAQLVVGLYEVAAKAGAAQMHAVTRGGQHLPQVEDWHFSLAALSCLSFLASTMWL